MSMPPVVITLQGAPIKTIPKSKSVAKWYNCLISELMKQIILYSRQNGLLARNNVGLELYMGHFCDPTRPSRDSPMKNIVKLFCVQRIM